MVGGAYGYYRNCFDYAVPEVRRRMLDYMAEQLDRYDVDGLEMDFMREAVCFDYVNRPDKAEIMNGFMRDADRITKAAEKKRGHKIKRIVRLPREIEQCLVYGFDPETWVREGLAEHVNVTPRWESCDNDMPIARWKERMPSAEISAGIETLCLRNDGGPAHADADVVNGLAAAYVSQGADAVYLYNYYLNPYRDPTNAAAAAYARRTEDVIRRCGSGKTIFSSPRRHIVTFQDIAPAGCARYKPLPLPVGAGDVKEISLPVGRVFPSARAKLILGFSAGSPASVRVSVNGENCTGWSPCTVPAPALDFTPTDAGYAKSGVKLYGCPIAARDADRYVIRLEAAEDAVLDYAEVRIR
jgi:hypothetical protein